MQRTILINASDSVVSSALDSVYPKISNDKGKKTHKGSKSQQPVFRPNNVTYPSN